MKTEWIKLRAASQHLLEMLDGIDWDFCAEDSEHAEDIAQAIGDVRGLIDETKPRDVDGTGSGIDETTPT